MVHRTQPLCYYCILAHVLLTVWLGRAAWLVYIRIVIHTLIADCMAVMLHLLPPEWRGLIYILPMAKPRMLMHGRAMRKVVLVMSGVILSNDNDQCSSSPKVQGQGARSTCRVSGGSALTAMKIRRLCPNQQGQRPRMQWRQSERALQYSSLSSLSLRIDGLSIVEMGK